MKIALGVDYGDARTGLAVSDALGFLASGCGCIKGNGFKKIAEQVVKTAKEKNAEIIVVGNPLNMDGTSGPRSEKCRDFAEYIEEISGIKTVLQDERLTTVEAYGYLSESNVFGKKRKNSVDELSATIILQDFMESHKDSLK